MPWDVVDPSDQARVERCVDLGAMTSDIDKADFGTSDLAREKALKGIRDGMQDSGGIRYVQIMYLKSYSGGADENKDDVALFFQKMKWMSANAGLGDVWVLTVAFAQDGLVLPEPGTVSDDTAYVAFLNALTAEDGPLHTFMNQEGVKVSSLFTVGPVADPPPNRNREISWLEYVARDPWLWKANYGKWLFGESIYVDKEFTGAGDTAISPGALQHWCFPGQHAFQLTEIGFIAP
jgi:hypothetical protein